MDISFRIFDRKFIISIYYFVEREKEIWSWRRTRIAMICPSWEERDSVENSVWTLIKDSSLSRWREKHNLNVNFAPSRSLDSPPLFDYNKFWSSLLMATPLSINRISTLKNSEVRKRHRSSSIDFGEKSLRRLRSSKKNSRRFLISPNIFTRLWFEGGEAERTRC